MKKIKKVDVLKLVVRQIDDLNRYIGDNVEILIDGQGLEHPTTDFVFNIHNLKEYCNTNHIPAPQNIIELRTMLDKKNIVIEIYNNSCKLIEIVTELKDIPKI